MWKYLMIELGNNLIELEETVNFAGEKLCDELYKVPGKTCVKLVDTVDDISENRETVIILGLAAAGVACIVGRVVMKIPIPPIVEKKMLAPIIGVMTVAILAKSAEKRATCG